MVSEPSTHDGLARAEDSGSLGRGRSLKIAAVIATCDRPRLLANRSLPSITSQSRAPDCIIVVDDSDARFRPENQAIVDGLGFQGVNAVYLGNYRTVGASGAWNTALAWLQAHEPEAFVALLDDDDAWDPYYLEHCESAAVASHLDIVAVGLLRHESDGDAGIPLSAPDRLKVDQLLVGNPHIQASNLFVRLGVLLEAGGFDEALRSTTDRDLCIRLAGLGQVRYGTVGEHLVHHHAEPDRERLSTPGSTGKCEGLRAFYAKYRGRMTPPQREAFLARSRDLFGSDPERSMAESSRPAGPTEQAAHDPGGRLVLVVGVVTSPTVVNTANLLRDLSELAASRKDVELKVVLLENGGADRSARSSLRDGVIQAASELDLSLITLEQQTKDLDAGWFGIERDRLPERKSIALSRTMLQHYVYVEAKVRPGSVVWLLDDDCRLEAVVTRGSGRVARQSFDPVSHLKMLKSSGHAVVLGAVTGAPPVPAASCVRTQLVDLYHNLEWMATLAPDEPLPDRLDENLEVMRRRRDYYYDLSRGETDHLETPFWYVAAQDDCTVGEAFREMVGRLPDILRGIQVYRPLALEPTGDPMHQVLPSVNRGPSTFVFDIEALRDFPNAVPSIDGFDTRRSDMVWSLLNRFAAGRSVVSAPLPVRQDRTSVEPASFGFETLVRDIEGYALYSGLHDVFRRKARQRQLDGKSSYGPALLNFTEADLDLATDRFQKYLGERVNAFELSFLRIRGLVRSFRRHVDATAERRPWWLTSEEYDESVGTLAAFVERMESVYVRPAMERVRHDAQGVDLAGC